MFQERPLYLQHETVKEENTQSEDSTTFVVDPLTLFENTQKI